MTSRCNIKATVYSPYGADNGKEVTVIDIYTGAHGELVTICVTNDNKFSVYSLDRLTFADTL